MREWKRDTNNYRERESKRDPDRETMSEKESKRDIKKQREKMRAGWGENENVTEGRRKRD